MSVVDVFTIVFAGYFGLHMLALYLEFLWTAGDSCDVLEERIRVVLRRYWSAMQVSHREIVRALAHALLEMPWPRRAARTLVRLAMNSRERMIADLHEEADELDAASRRLREYHAEMGIAISAEDRTLLDAFADRSGQLRLSAYNLKIAHAMASIQERRSMCL